MKYSGVKDLKYQLVDMKVAMIYEYICLEWCKVGNSHLITGNASTMSVMNRLNNSGIYRGRKMKLDSLDTLA